MADIKIKYDAAAAITVTLTSLADGSARQATEISNTSDLYDDALLRIKTNGQSGGTAFLEVYLFSAVGDTIRTGGAGASDAAFSGQVTELAFLGVVDMNAATGVVVILEGVAEAFGGVLPEKWAPVFSNGSGAALSATAGDHDVDVQGITYQTI